MKTLTLLSGIFFLSIAVHAQTGKGTVAGKVKDKHGQPIPYTTVSLKGFQSGAVTNEQGNFIFRAAPGNYRLVATSVGYTTIDTTLKITENATVQMNITLPDNNSQLKEVEVSGVKLKSAASTRTLTQIQDIPQAVVVIGQKVIKQQAAFDLTTITRNISGVNFNGNYSGAGSYQFFSARGFDLSGSQNYRWNGMMIWNLGNNYADNIEQVEFLKGPASILYGDVAPGGVMNFVTKKPLSEFMARAEFKTGSWGLVRPSIDITGPIDKKQHLRFRVNASYEKSNSFRDFVKSDKSFLAPSIAWDITPKLSVVAEVVFNKTRSTDDAGLVSPDGTIKGLSLLKPSLYLGDPNRKYLFNETNYFTTINYELSKTWRFKVTGFYGVTGNRPNGLWFDQPDSVGNFVRESYAYYQHLKNGTVTADLSGTFFTGSIKHNILFGVDYQSTHYRYTNEGALTPFDTMNIFHPVYGQTVSPPVPERPFLPYVALIERTGIFAQDQLMFFNNKLHVLVGLRAGRTKQGNHYFQDQLAGTAYEGSTDNIISKNVWTPRLGVVYKPKEWLSLYGSYSKGYEVNSPDLFALNYKEFAVPPPTISDQIEFGAKGNLNDKLGVSLSLYTINKHDPYGYVYENPENPDYDRYNIYYKGHHQSMGIEMDVDGKLFPVLSITAGASLNQAKVIWDPGYSKGNELPNAPKFMGNLWLNYEPLSVIKGFTAGAGIFYKGKFFTSLANDPTLQIPGSYTLDLSAGYKYKNFDLQVNAMNITNRVNYLNPWAFNLFDVRPLRQYVVTLSYQFRKSKAK